MTSRKTLSDVTLPIAFPTYEPQETTCRRCGNTLEGDEPSKLCWACYRPTHICAFCSSPTDGHEICDDCYQELEREMRKAQVWNKTKREDW